jgi:ketosteroid isomerase-like protein
MENDTDAIVRTYTEYFGAFQSLDPEAVLPFYHMPFLALMPAGVVAVGHIDSARALFAPMMMALRARGYARSEWSRLGVQQLSESAAVLSCDVARHKADGSVLERFGATYAFHRTDSGWKIAMLVIHDREAVLDLPRPEQAT